MQLEALSLTMAMTTSKGNALLVMPIVFGGAVSVTALISVIRLYGHATFSPLLWVGMALVAVGIVLVASNTPHGHAAPTTVAPEMTSDGLVPPAIDTDSLAMHSEKSSVVEDSKLPANQNSLAAAAANDDASTKF